MPPRIAVVARDTMSLVERAGVRADGPPAVALSEPPLVGFSGCLDEVQGVTYCSSVSLPLRFLTILILERKSGAGACRRRPADIYLASSA